MSASDKLNPEVNPNTRFWFGHLNDRKGGSLVIWDRNGPAAPEGSTFLYVLRRDAIVQFATDIVKRHLQPADAAEIKYLSSYALESYFSALSRHFEDIRSKRGKPNPQAEGIACDEEDYVANTYIDERSPDEIQRLNSALNAYESASSFGEFFEEAWLYSTSTAKTDS